MEIPLDTHFVRLLIRLILGVIFLSSGMSEITHPQHFRRGIQDYQVLPLILESKIALSMILAWCIPLVELVVGLGLISGLRLVPIAFLSLALLLLFSGAITINLIHGRRDLSCHCGGVLSDHHISWWLVGRNGFFTIGLLILILTPDDTFTLDTFISNPSELSRPLLSTVLPAVLLAAVVLIALVLINHAQAIWKIGSH